MLSLISLVHIPEKELSDLKAAIGSSDGIPHVVIHNWPSNKEPCSRAEMYYIFQATKPHHQEEVDETFVMFIDHDGSPNGGYRVILADEPLSTLQPIGLSWLFDNKDALRFWHAVWHPFEHGRRGTRRGHARVNTTIFDGDLRHRKTYFEDVYNPDDLLFSGNCVIFILSQMTETQFRRVRQKFSDATEETLQFVDVSRHVKTPDIKGLMGYFESDEFVNSGKEPPTHFLAIDNWTPEGVTKDDEDNNKAHENDEASVIVISKHGLSVSIKDDKCESYASWYPGYAYCKLDAEQAVNLWVNLDVGNMDLIDMCGEPEFAYWDGFRQWRDMNEDMTEKSGGRIDIEGACYSLS